MKFSVLWEELKKSAIPIFLLGIAVVSFLKYDTVSLNTVTSIYLIYRHLENIKKDIISEIKKNIQ